MIGQMQRLTRARQQLEQMGRANHHIGDPTRITSSEEQSLQAIERTRLGGPLPRPAHPPPVPADDPHRPPSGQAQPQEAHIQGPHDEADELTHHEADRLAVDGAAIQHDDGQGSDSSSLYQTAFRLGYRHHRNIRHLHSGGFSPTGASSERYDNDRASSSDTSSSDD